MTDGDSAGEITHKHSHIDYTIDWNSCHVIYTDVLLESRSVKLRQVVANVKCKVLEIGKSVGD